MTKTEIFARIRAIREELENRHKYGTVKFADSNGVAISTEKLQNEMFALIYKVSKLD